MIKNLMKYAMPFYIILAVILNAVLTIIYIDHISINASSLIPIAVLMLMLIQSLLMFSNSRTYGDTAYSHSSLIRLTDAEEQELYAILRKTLLCLVPLCIPFVLFFSTYVKLLSIMIYFVSFIASGIIFKLKNRNKIKGRIQKEAHDLREQQKKEELGNL